MDTLNNFKKIKTENNIEEKWFNSHSKDLGYEVPKDYFLNSKKEILEKTVFKQEKTKVISFKKKNIWLSIAASVVILLSITIYQTEFGFFKGDSYLENRIALLDEENNDLIASLFMEGYDFIDFYFDIEQISEESDHLITSLFIENNIVTDPVDFYLNDQILKGL